MKKLLFILPHCSTGGMPQVALKKIELLNNLYEIYAIEYSDISPHFIVQKNKIKNLLNNKFITLSNNKFEILEYINTIQPDIIHFEEIPEYFMNEEIADKIYNNNRNYYIIETTHDSSFNITNKKFIPDKFAFISDYSIQQFATLNIPAILTEYPIEYSVRPNRNETLLKLGLNPEQKHILTVGLFTPRKNQKEIIEYAKLLKNENIQFHFVGNLADNFKWYWEPLLKDLPENCKIWGERKDTEIFYSCMDLFLFTSKGNNDDKETNPLVIKEALSWQMNILLYPLDVYLGKYDNNFYIDHLKDNQINENINLIKKILHIKTSKICVISPTKNEINILDFYFDYYLNFINADKIIIFDGNSTDGSIEKINQWQKNYPNKIELFIDNHEVCDERDLMNIRNQKWKLYREVYDWQIVCDVDEFLYHPDIHNILNNYKNNNVTIPNIKGYDMISMDFPIYKNSEYLPNLIRTGNYNPRWLNKNIIFNPKKIEDINYDFGCHSCNPTGENITYSDRELYLLHYKWLSYEYLINKTKYQYNRLSNWSIENGAGIHNKEFSEMNYYSYHQNYLNSEFVHDNMNNNMIYKKIDGWFDFQEIYDDMINTFADGDIFVELGAWLGKSTSYMAEKIKLSKKDIKFYTIDHFKGDPNIGELKQRFPNLKDNTVYELYEENTRELSNYINLLQMNNDEAITNFKDKSCKFIFLDATKIYEDVKNDLNKWYPKLSENGIIAGHDYYSWPEVQKAVDEFALENDLLVYTRKSSWFLIEPDNNKLNYFSFQPLQQKQNKFTIIIPTYNRNHLLKDAIDSVLNQNYLNYTIEVCHDGESEDFYEFSSNYNHNNHLYRKIKFGHNFKNYGNWGAYTRNHLTKICNDGEYIIYLDDDNILYSNALSDINKEINKTNADIVISKIHFDGSGWSDLILPKIDSKIELGSIDTLNICVKSDIAKKYNWDLSLGHDYRFIKNCYDYCIKNNKIITFSQNIIGKHREMNENKEIKKIKKELVIISAHPNYKAVENTLIKSIVAIKNSGRDVLVSSHAFVDKKIQELSDYVIYDKNNPLIKHDFYNLSWYENDERYVEINLEKNKNNNNHALGVLINYYNGIIFAQSMNYEKIHCINFDIIINEKDYVVLDKISDILNTHSAYFMNTIEQEGQTLKTIYFAIKPEFFLKYFKNIKTEDEYNQSIIHNKSETNCLENYFYNILKNNLNEIYLEHITEEELFPNSEVNLFSMIEYFTILKKDNCENQFIIWFSSLNKLDDRNLIINIFENDKLSRTIESPIDNNFILEKSHDYNNNILYKIECIVKNQYNEIIKNNIIEFNNINDIKDNGKYIEKNNANETIAIATRIKNMEEFLPYLYKSIKKQNYSNWKWYIFDNNEHNNLIDYINNLNDNRIIYVKLNNFLDFWEQLKNVKEEIITIVDADDLLNSNCIEEITEVFKNKEIGFYCGSSIKFEENTKLIEYYNSKFRDESNDIYNTHPIAFRKSLIFKINLDINIPLTDDYEFLNNLMQLNEKFIISENITYFYRINHDSSLCTSSGNLTNYQNYPTWQEAETTVFEKLQNKNTKNYKDNLIQIIENKTNFEKLQEELNYLYANEFNIDNFSVWFEKDVNDLHFLYKNSDKLLNTNYLIQICDIESNLPIYNFEMNMKHQYWAQPYNEDMYINYKKRCIGYLIKIYQNDKFINSKILKLSEGSNFSFPVKYNYYFKDAVISSYLDFMHNDIYGDFIKNCEVIIDAGANIGVFVQYAKIKNPNLKSIFAIEANPICYEYLKSNFSFPEFQPYLGALYSTSGEILKLHVNKEHTTSTSIIKNTDNCFEEIEIETISLDRIINNYSIININKIDLLKLDIEGAEYEIFKNISIETLQKIDKIIIEYHFNEGENDLSIIINKLKDAGFIYSETTDFQLPGFIRHKRQGTFYARRINV